MKLRVFALSACLLLSSRVALAQCAGDADCRGGRICREGSCVEAAAAACGKDTDCPEPMLCLEQQCRAPAPTAPPAAGPSGTAPKKEIVYAEREVSGIPEMWIPGLVVLTLAWGATIGITAGVDGSGERIAFAAIPVFGPFILLGEASDDYIAPLVISGVVQTAGLGFFIAGLALSRTERIPVGVALSEGPDPLQLVFMPGPVGAPGSFGLNASLINF